MRWPSFLQVFLSTGLGYVQQTNKNSAERLIQQQQQFALQFALVLHITYNSYVGEQIKG